MQAVQQRQAAARSEQVQCGHGAGNVKLAANAGCCVAERKHGCANGTRRAECKALAVLGFKDNRIWPSKSFSIQLSDWGQEMT